MERAACGTWRYTLVFTAILVVLGGLCVRTAGLMRGLYTPSGNLVNQARACEMIEVQQRMIVPVPGRPGDIYMSTRQRPVPLAISKQVLSVFADPAQIPPEKLPDVAIAAGEALKLDPVRLQETLVLRGSSEFAWLDRNVPADEIKALKASRIMLDGRRGPTPRPLPGVEVTYEWRRFYPQHDLAANVVGFMQGCGEAGGGVELMAQDLLKAEDGVNVVVADAWRRPMGQLADKCRKPTDGGHIVLTLDVTVQRCLQEQLAAAVEKFGGPNTWASGVVVEPRTGRILAMACVPTFDPNVLAGGSASQQELHQAVEHSANRGISMPYEPGSAFKPLIAAAAVDRGVVSWQTGINCEGGVYSARDGGTISDHGAHYGVLTVEDVNVFSSNIGMAKIGEMLGNPALFDIVSKYGFGKPTGVELPGETPGIVRKLAKMDGYSLRRVPFGQEISVSTLQLAMAYAALANDGKLMKPLLYDTVYYDENGADRTFRGKPAEVRSVVRPQTARQAVAVMEQVVQRGTGKACKSRYWTTWGKTGTAQIAKNGVYVDRAFTGTFVGGAPVSEPKALVVISVYWPDYAKGHFGATVAAPYVKEVLEKTLSYMDVPFDVPQDIASSAPPRR
jgi:cell division protein FtsI/penicillin-binding protein 2